MHARFGLFAIIACIAPIVAPPARATGTELVERFADPDLPAWVRSPENFADVKVADGRAVLKSDQWAALVTKDEFDNVALSTSITILEPAKRFSFAGQSWTVWTDYGWGDAGYEAGLLLRASADGRTCYRVQLSHKFQEVTLAKWPMGSFLRVAPCEVKLGQPHRVQIEAVGPQITVKVDGQAKIQFVDALLPLAKGRVGLAVSSQAKIALGDVEVRSLAAASAATPPAEHRPEFALREWRGRPWVFDGQEPILLVATPNAGSPCHQNAKLRPGYRPLLMWNAQWDIANQDAFKEGRNKISEVSANGGGSTLSLEWTARHVADAFKTRSQMTVGWNAERQVYVYDTDSSLEMLPGKSFTFRYGFDFEHHTALDPFRWESLLLKSADGRMFRRPLTPYDSGPIENLAQPDGFRAWVGRRGEPFVVGPAVEYQISPGGSRGRKLNTAVCAWAYDTGGASFPQETLKEGDKIEVHFRYTGVPAAELLALRDKAEPPPLERTRPDRHFIFAEPFPKLDFSQYASLADTWAYGRVPFLSGHNAAPLYTLATNTGFHGGYAMRLGPGGHAAANLPIEQPLAAGRYIVTAWTKADNLLGPGARMELLLTKANTGHGYPRQNASNILQSEKHFLGVGSWDWKQVGFVSALAAGAKSLAIELANSGTGEILFTDFEIRPLPAGEPLPAGIAPAPNETPAPLPPKPTGVLADYRMLEGKGLVVFDHAGGPFGMLGLANLDWVSDEGRPALRFAENTSARKEFAGAVTSYFGSPSYVGKETLPVAIAGQHGGGFELKGLTISAFIKPAAAMGQSQKNGKGDIVGLGARRFILGLVGEQAPYRLTTRLNVNDIFTAPDKLEADRWYHVALSGVPGENNKWRIRLWLDGRMVLEGDSKNFAAPTSIPPSLILGAELFYLHDAYYRGLIGRVTVFDRELDGKELAALARER